jgi:hypothetical protein
VDVSIHLDSTIGNDATNGRKATVMLDTVAGTTNHAGCVDRLKSGVKRVGARLLRQWGELAFIMMKSFEILVCQDPPWWNK